MLCSCRDNFVLAEKQKQLVAIQLKNEREINLGMTSSRVWAYGVQLDPSHIFYLKRRVCCLQGRPLFFLGGGDKIKDFNDFPAPSQANFQTYSTAVFSMWHSFYSIESVDNTDFHYIAYSSPMTAPFFHTMVTTDQWPFWNSSTSLTSYTKFQNFQPPNPFWMTFQGFEKWKKFQGLSQGLSTKSGQPVFDKRAELQLCQQFKHWQQPTCETTTKRPGSTQPMLTSNMRLHLTLAFTLQNNWPTFDGRSSTDYVTDNQSYYSNKKPSKTLLTNN